MITNDASRELEFLSDALDLLSALFSGPGAECPELAGEHVPAFRRELDKAPERLFGAFDRLLEAWSAEDPSAFCSSMESEYVRIFVNTKGGIAAPLYQSVYQPGSSGLMGSPAVEMSRRLAEQGLELDVQGEPPDHLGVELEYLALLLASASPGDEIPKEARDFAKNLLEWLPDFHEAVKRADPPPAYELAAEAVLAVADYLGKP